MAHTCTQSWMSFIFNQLQKDWTYIYEFYMEIFNHVDFRGGIWTKEAVQWQIFMKDENWPNKSQDFFSKTTNVLLKILFSTGSNTRHLGNQCTSWDERELLNIQLTLFVMLSPIRNIFISKCFVWFYFFVTSLDCFNSPTSTGNCGRSMYFY